MPQQDFGRASMNPREGNLPRGSAPLGQGETILTAEDLDALARAKRILEKPSFAAKITNALGTPLEKGLELLPENISALVRDIARQSLAAALRVALLSMNRRRVFPAHTLMHRIAVTATGAAGGAFGLPALALELPVSTAIMLRSIADIARAEGENLEDPAAKLACIEVFALSGRSRGDDASESGYFVVRAALARSVTEAVEYLAERGVAKEGAPVLVRLLSQVSERFGVTVSEKVATQAVPAIGAAGGAVINLIFIDLYQDLARGHFSVRRLERKYGTEAVQAAYLRLVV
jgi:hypothetical protein